MSLDVYFRRDIANILRATARASEGAAGLAIELLGDAGLITVAGQPVEITQEQLLQVYRRGVRHALVAVGLGFGLEPVGPDAEKAQVGQPLAGLLWAELRE